MQQLILAVAFAAAFATPAAAQGIELLKEQPREAPLSRIDVMEIRQFEQRFKDELEVIRKSCEEHMTSQYDAQVIDVCIRQGVREYLLNYQSISAYLTARLEREAP